MKTKGIVRIIIWAVVLLMPCSLWAQSYEELWNEVYKARTKDLPQTAITHLQKIEKKALREKNYGELLASTLSHSRMQCEISPDSLKPAVDRLEKEYKTLNDVVLKAVYATVLSTVYSEAGSSLDDSKERSQVYYNEAIAHPDALAPVKASVYYPLVSKGNDSELYGHDLLSVVGSELRAWQWLSDYYTKAGNRPAACITGLKELTDRQKSRLKAMGPHNYTDRLDSLIALYGDLLECCEVAIERYNFMSDNKDYTLQEKADWLQESLRRWGDWKRSNWLRNEWSALINPYYSVSAENHVVRPDSAQTVTATFRNLQSLTVKIYRTKLDGETDLDPSRVEDYKKLKGGLTELTELEKTYTFLPHREYESYKKTFQVPGLPAGIYMLEFSSQPTTAVSRRLYFVSGLQLMMLPLPDNQLRYVAVDAISGMPLHDASLKLKFDAGWRKPMTVKTVKCDDNGEAIYQYEVNKMPQKAFVYTADDKYCPQSNLSGRYSYYEPTYGSEHTSLFTDRSIYRPGQKVYATAIVWKEKSGLDNETVANKRVVFTLRDANYKQVAEQTVTTDRFGKCSTEFTLPQGQLNGRFTVRANTASNSIRVEEYKRPTFQIEFDEYKESYQKGDTVRTLGKALTYAGVPVQGAKVKYKVERRVAWWWLSYSWYWGQGAFGRSQESETVYEEETTTDDDGHFKVVMPMVMPYNLGSRAMYYHFDVTADVTDVAGETHSGTMSLPLGSKPTALTCDMSQQVRIDKLSDVTFSRRNAAGQPIEGTVQYRFDSGKWKACAANEAVSLKNSGLKSGQHCLEAICEADTVNMTFTIFSLDDKKAVIKEGNWFYVSDYQFPANGSAVTIQAGAVSDGLHIVYGLFSGDKELERGRIDKKNSELLNLKLKYKEEYGNGLLAVFSWVKDGVPHSFEASISRPLPDKTLRMEWETFRDRLTPGQQEVWRLKVTAPPTGKSKERVPADASLMAVLYDKSLDQLSPHQWHLSPSNYLPRPSASWTGFHWSGLSGSGYASYKRLSYPTFQYSSFNREYYPVPAFRSVIAYGRSSSRMLMKSAAVESGPREVGAVLEEAREAPMMAVADNAAVADEADEDSGSGEQQEQSGIRENLNETAFCYPAVETDQEGRVSLSFTLPECLTTWRFMGVSHTVDMLTGYIGAEAVAQKDVMIQPNMPRFIRMGDEPQISARIFNTADHDISGQAKLLLIDPETDRVVFEREQSFATAAGKTASVTFSLADKAAAWADYSLLICKVVASGDGFSDGEQHYLPILPDREHVTKTVPITQHEPGVQRIDLTKLFPAGTTQQKLTVEYTNNPVWLMVQSLPVIGQPWEYSAIDQCASYYSNTLAKHLLAQSPNVKATFEQWKREQGPETTLQSQLEKNQELKDLVLSETPWVRDADRESEQRQRLSDFFDANGINNRLSTALAKLKKLQRSDGSFSWYPDMPGSTSITVAVEEMLVRLKAMVGEQRDVKQLQDKAFDFIGKEMVEMVDEMKKLEKKKGYKPTFPSFTALRWLYLCAVDGRQLSSRVKSANDYLINLMKKDIQRQSIYEKALSAVILSKHGESKIAAEYVQSLKEYTVFTEEMGRYYDTKRAFYSWYDYKIPTEVAAMEAIQMVAPQDKQTVDEMRRWLLQEKRTQTWDTPINSVNAIYAFLNGHTKSLDSQGKPTVIAIDGQPMDLPKATAGLGYVKTAVANPKGKELTADKTSEGTSWGAVYGQFLQKTSEVEASQSGITVKRELLVKTGGAAAKYVPFTSKASLQVGDKVLIRITIQSTRDLDFVQVVDRRAACMEPVRQLSGYRNGIYCSPKDNATHYYYYMLSKGKHVLETEYYIDRAGRYESGTCTVGCAYSPEFRATCPSLTFNIK